MKLWKGRPLLVGVIFLVSVCFVLPAIAEEAVQELEKKEGVKEKARKEYELEPMTVTAEKREEDIQEVPASISALSDIQIEYAEIVSIHDMALQIPNLYIATPGWRAVSVMAIRGIGTGNAMDQTIGFYVDDVNYSIGYSIDTELFDIERIEVLRGPQGTLYGRNTLGGVVNIITKKPGNQWEGKASVGYGNYNSQDYRASIRGPMVKDKLFLGISGVKNKRDGYADNTYLGTEPDDRDATSGRVHLNWLPTDALDITLSANAEKQRNGTAAWGPIEEIRHDPYKVRYNYDGYEDVDSNDQTLRLGYEATWFKLTSITGRRDYEYEQGDIDTDSSPIDMLVNYSDCDQEQWSQELRIQSPEDSGSLKWLVGTYWFKEDIDMNVSYDMHAWGMKTYQLSKMGNQGYAFFGQATYTLFEKLGLTAGLRYDHEKKETDWKTYTKMAGMIVPGSESEMNPDEDYDEWLPKFTIDYRWTPSLMTYVSAAKGYKSGGFNYMVSDPLYISYDPEYTWNYEAGCKSTWLDNRLMLNLAAFYIKWTDQHVRLTVSPTEWAFQNAAESHSQGFEAELIARPITGLEFVAGFGYTDAKFDDYRDPIYNPMTGLKIGENVYDDKRINGVPKYTCNIAAQYRHKTGLFGRVELQGIGKSYWDSANEIEEDAYELVNSRLGYETEHFDIYLYAKNIFDKEYLSAALDMGNYYGARAGDPQTFGIMLTGRF